MPKSPCSQLRFLELKRLGKLRGYYFIGWLNETGELVKDMCPHCPHIPIYWKKEETGEWFCLSQTALHETTEHAILSVDDWKRLMQSFSQSWRFLGFVHDASGQCIIHVPPPISSQTDRNSGIRNTKVRTSLVPDGQPVLIIILKPRTRWHGCCRTRWCDFTLESI